METTHLLRLSAEAANILGVFLDSRSGRMFNSLMLAAH